MSPSGIVPMLLGNAPDTWRRESMYVVQPSTVPLMSTRSKP